MSWYSRSCEVIQNIVAEHKDLDLKSDAKSFEWESWQTKKTGPSG